MLAILDMLVSFREGDRSGGKEAIWLIDEGLGGFRRGDRPPWSRSFGIKDLGVGLAKSLRLKGLLVRYLFLYELAGAAEEWIGGMPGFEKRGTLMWLTRGQECPRYTIQPPPTTVSPS